MSIVYRDTEAPSCDRQHYKPARRKTTAERVVLAVCCLALFAALGIAFAVGLSGCGEPQSHGVQSS